ncbi:MAG: hypothetical protein LUH13_03345, partial [Oscillospiraceae bacterium]|nr:hypothetical protein [Oscillospiraceae bacterium]
IIAFEKARGICYDRNASGKQKSRGGVASMSAVIRADSCDKARNNGEVFQLCAFSILIAAAFCRCSASSAALAAERRVIFRG